LSTEVSINVNFTKKNPAWAEFIVTVQIGLEALTRSRAEFKERVELYV